jgi:hypothetical protein
MSQNKSFSARCQWLTPVFLAISEGEIREITAQSQFGRPYLKKTLSKKGLGE